MDNYEDKFKEFLNQDNESTVSELDKGDKDYDPRRDGTLYNTREKPEVGTSRKQFMPNDGDFESFNTKTHFIAADDVGDYAQWLSKDMN